MPPKFIDLEMNRCRYAADHQSQPYSARNNFRETVYGSDSSNHIIRDGIETCIDYIEDQIVEYINKPDGILDALCKAPASLDERVNLGFDVASKVALMLFNLDPQSSLEDLAKELIKCYNSKELSAAEDTDSRSAQHLVLDCIGWISMCYAPSPELTKEVFATEIDATKHPGPSRGASPVSRRPLGAVLRAFMPIQCRPEMPYTNNLRNAGTLLTVACLNYFSLHNIGKLSIDWTEKLSDHCLLDIPRRRLKLFRFPAFCAQAYTGQRAEQILTRILQAHICRQNCAVRLPPAVHQFLHEVLLSYRLLFGTSKRSRKLFRATEAARAGRSAGRLLDPDPVLSTLCGRRDASEVLRRVGARVGDGQGPVTVFDSLRDFPELGERLRGLQEYMLAQKPTGLWDVWNDHRDPYHTFTFWVVVIVGGSSVFLSFLQVVVSVGQLVVAVR